jgi:hypothetical protein
MIAMCRFVAGQITTVLGGYMKMKKPLCLLIFMLLLGCSHEVTVKPIVSPVASKLIDQKIEGNIAIFISPELAELSKIVEPHSRYCSATNFPLEAGQSIKASLIKTAQNVFKNCRPVDSVPQNHGFDGILAAELLDFDVDLKFSDGTWSGTAESWVEMNILLTFYDAKLNPIWRSVVGYSKKDFADAGPTCGGGAVAISGSMEQCLKNISIQMAEKIADSNKIKVTLARAPRR